MEHPIKMDDLGVPLFSETSIIVNSEMFSIPDTLIVKHSGDCGPFGRPAMCFPVRYTA